MLFGREGGFVYLFIVRKRGRRPGMSEFEPHLSSGIGAG